MIAETPQIEEPIARRLVSFGVSPNRRPSHVITATDAASSIVTRPRLSVRSFITSPGKNRDPWKMIPIFSQNA
jgi:hypothetical protein